MRYNITFSLCLFFTSALSNPGSWLKKTDLTAAGRFMSTGFAIGTKGYLGTGWNGIFNATGYFKDFWEWDQATNTWTQKADQAGGGRMQSVSFSVGLKGYVGMGQTFTGAKQDFWEYDQAGNFWTQVANFPSAKIGSVGFSIGLKGYVGLGGDKEFWEYDPSVNSWNQKTDYPGLSVGNAAGFSISGKGYIGTGLDAAWTVTNDFWEYDPATNAWVKKANFGGAARGEAVGFSIGNYGYIGIGTTSVSAGSVSDFWQYDLCTDTWTQVADFGGGVREMAVGFAIGNLGYVGTGGVNDAPPWSKDFWEYTPDVAPCFLPVDMLTFTAEPVENKYVSAKWITSAEINNDYFLIQRSKDVQHWEDVGIAKGAGTSNITHSYSIPDMRPYQGISYYRLKQVNFNGGYEYYGPVPVRLGGMEIITIYPTPATDHISYSVVSSLEGGIVITFTDVLGRKVMTQKDVIHIGENKFSLSLQDITSGFYLLRLEEQSGTARTQKQFMVK